MNGKILVSLAVLALAPIGAEAQSYRCIGKDGKRYYGATVPAECYGRPVEQLNAQGIVVRRVDPEGSEKERLAKEAGEAKKREQELAAREAARRNRALLATYTSAQDIEDARARALADNSQTIREVEGRIEAIRHRQSGYAKELELHKGKNEPPARLRDDIKMAEHDLKLQQQLLEVKQREVDAINARYDDDKKRYTAITGRR